MLHIEHKGLINANPTGGVLIAKEFIPHGHGHDAHPTQFGSKDSDARFGPYRLVLMHQRALWEHPQGPVRSAQPFSGVRK